MKNNNFNMKMGKDAFFDLQGSNRPYDKDFDQGRYAYLGSGVGISGTKGNVDRGIVGTQGFGIGFKFNL